MGPQLRVELVPTNSLTPDPGNPRKHTKAQLRQIGRSMTAFGNNVPILVDRANKIIAGHGRWEAARQLGLAELPVIRLEHLTDAQARAFAIADNRLTDNSEWDTALLAGVLKGLSAEDLDFDLETTGFSVAEIDVLIAGLPAVDDKPDTADTIPEPKSENAVSQIGDLWMLGPHKVFCASALESAAYDRLLGKEKAHGIFTDPPYNVRIDGHATGNGAARHREFAMASGEMSPGQFTAFLSTTCAHLARYAVDGAIHYLCMDWRHVDALLAAGKVAYSELKNICVWTKNNAGMGSFYRSQHEFVLVFKSGSGPHRNNIELGRHGRHRSNVWAYPGASTFSRSSDEGYLLGLHPTVKPVRMVADAILDTTRRGDIVLDPFGGSGTTVIAAERTGRRAYVIELDPLYVDTIVRRWQNYTGDDARHPINGKTFTECEREARNG